MTPARSDLAKILASEEAAVLLVSKRDRYLLVMSLIDSANQAYLDERPQDGAAFLALAHRVNHINVAHWTP